MTSFQEIKKALATQKTTCVQLVNSYLKTIKEQEHLNAFLEIYEQEALERAVSIDQKIATKTAGKLAGMVVGLKDVICYKNHKIQASSKMLADFESQFSATVVARLLKEDAIIIGRQNCDEFGMGSSNENSAFGTVKNPVDETRVPGGSSGGSAVAVATGMCLVSLGSDTGGSVRQPAAFCGVLGLKPTYSRISRWGLIAYASSFDTVGILANNAQDIALVLETIAGKDEFDATSSARKVPLYSRKLATTSSKPKIAYIKETLENEGLNQEIKAQTVAKINQLKNSGHVVDCIDFPLLKYILPTYYILTTAEASTNLSRFDGVRYGHSNLETKDLEEMYKKNRSEGFGEEVKKRIMLGTYVLSASYYDAYFTKAQKVRRLIKEATEKILEEYDFLILPTTPSSAFKIGKHHQKNSLEMYLADLFTVQASVAGIPAISIPNGEDKNGLPIGLQIMAAPFKEHELLSFVEDLTT